jgi:hypothetical protein
VAAPTLPGCYTVGNGNSTPPGAAGRGPRLPGWFAGGPRATEKSALLTDLVNRADHRTDPEHANPRSGTASINRWLILDPPRTDEHGRYGERTT